MSAFFIESDVLWSKLSPQLRGNLVDRDSMEKDGFEAPMTLKVEDFTPEEWGALSFQMRARILAARSLYDENLGH